MSFVFDRLETVISSTNGYLDLLKKHEIEFDERFLW